MEACEPVLGIFAHMRREARNRARIARFQFGKCLQIAFRGRMLVYIDRKRLERAQRLGFASEHQVTNRPTPEILSFRGEGRTDTNPGRQLFVCGLESCCHVDGVAIGGVIEESATTKIADDRWSS